LEDGRPTGEAHSGHRDIAQQGRGLYSHWAQTLYFSATDNSDPNENGRTYSLLIERNFQREQILATGVLDFMRQRLGALGPIESGLDYYVGMIEAENPFQPYDREIVRFALERAQRYSRYLEVGAGLGQLSALLAAEGLPSVAIEGDRRRAEAARAMHAWLSERVGRVASHMSVIEAVFPDEKVPVDGATLVLFTNVIHDDNGDHTLAACKDAGGIVIDLCRFGRSRTTTDGWRALIRQIRDLGFPFVDSVCAWGEPTSTDQASPSPVRIHYFYRTPQLRPNLKPA
jgi:hypothetical protein